MRSLFIISALFCFLTLPSSAQASSNLFLPEDGSLFHFVLVEPGEEIEGEIAEFSLSEGERQSVLLGADYYRQLLGPSAANRLPIKTLITTKDDYDDNASAFSPALGSGPYAGSTWLSAALAYNYFGESGCDYDEYLSLITIDRANQPDGQWYMGPMESLPQNGDRADLASTVLHELAHAFGLGSEAFGKDSFPNVLAVYDQGLRDIYGKPSKPNMPISTDGAANPSAFVTANDGAYSGVYFTGPKVAEVLNGARLSFPEDPDNLRGNPYIFNGDDTVPGLPVNGHENSDAEFSHIELRNSLMSHQMYRNWNTLMEAELALFEDLGLKLDRRAWYGYSVYNNGLTIVNHNPYFARQNGAWLTGQPSQTPWGVGLHVYGSDNNITQAADLLANGAYALGIRVDGRGNTITVALGTRVQADGLGGTALLVSYGRDQVVNLAGEASAQGQGGIAARFDFGDNEMSNEVEYRGSWIRSVGGNPGDDTADLPSELEGPLLNSFNVTGRLAGSRAASWPSPSRWLFTVWKIAVICLYTDSATMSPGPR